MCMYTPPKVNSLPLTSYQALKGKHRFPSIIFQGLCLASRGEKGRLSRGRVPYIFIHIIDVDFFNYLTVHRSISINFVRRGGKRTVKGIRR